MASQFGPLLRRFRTRAGQTQEVLAERAGLGVRTVRRLETGDHGDPRMGTVDALSAALGLTRAERMELLAAAGRHTPPTTGPPPPDAAPGPPDPLAEAAGLLAYELRARLRREEEQRQIHDPVPLPVRWTPAPAELTDSWLNIRQAGPGESAEPVPLGGELDDIVAVYRRLPSGRLVVLGRAGSGKTILTIRFVLGMLDVAAPGDPVPVVFGVGSWHPATTALRDWLIDQLLRDHPGLAAPGPDGVTLAAALVETGRILPVLDGFDEIGGGLHRAALAALNTTTLPLVVTSRIDEYRAAVESTDVLTSAGAVVLGDLTAADLADYLPRTTRKRGQDGTAWEPVLTEVREHPDGDLAAVLTTPLMVSLARTVYSDTPDHDPAELLDTGRYATREAIERHLLGTVVPAAYKDQPGRAAHETDRVEHWLGFLAHHLDRLGTHDLAWWQLGDRTPGWLRMVVSGMVLGLAAGIPSTCVIGLSHLFGVGTANGGFGTGLAAALAAGPMEGLAVALTVGLAHGAVLALGGAVFAPSRVRMRLRGRSRSGATFLRRLAVGVAVGTGLGAGLGIANVLGATFWIVGRIGTTVEATIVFGLTFGLLWGLSWGVLAYFEAPVDISSAISPVDLLSGNRRNVAVQALVFGLVTCLGYTVTVAVVHGPRLGLAYGMTYGVALGLVVGFCVASLTAWGTWFVFARVWLPLNGRLPWTLPAFLEDAYQRGVLRRSGAVYQFRHARLQDHLTQTYREKRFHRP
ncbi:NACHT domain-containing protein [Actinophytocola algeriensis]|uniref:Transcriptional regulator with XRE-family HTH domain n=1 Tax=Actinophytocola algeriensis TaxID=1768010 RepID=A0A7W7VFU3_9PSEU|nr:helix-turn-helix domain-containing protein [Actinophytocola algeriensis]MBB4908370.1 transcriptional regulator with XRE-family HTH domain [Actinophytocola algeriensis]MBE1475243.1 transcriptional regulator with XRE-family HTH domain [Actinophytocola algeriensis]